MARKETYKRSTTATQPWTTMKTPLRQTKIPKTTSPIHKTHKMHYLYLKTPVLRN
jgi:hypothetical protein